MFRDTLPADVRDARRAIYAGAVFLLDPTDASKRLVADVRALLVDVLGGEDIRAIPAGLDNDAWFEKIGRVRRELFLDPRWHDRVRDLLASYGFDPMRTAFDPLRLRAVAHRGHEEPRAAAVYYPHRDTWYAHSQAIVTWWVPLDDLSEEETFVFYPDRFSEPVPNDSEVFDYDAWVRDGWSLKIGWQDPEAGRRARYPSVLGAWDGGREVGFSCRRAQALLFSGAHFHRTLPHATGRARFSLDFRAVDLEDHARGEGAPNVDNRSRGAALVDYTMPSSTWAPSR
jgi:hypothetical protein